ncbi:hypothetical protein EV182_002300, partial [Spiromyces aspiralis]
MPDTHRRRPNVQPQRAFGQRTANNTPFRQAEREFKARIQRLPPDLGRVVDFRDVDGSAEHNRREIIPLKLAVDLHGLDSRAFNRGPTKAYTLASHPGLIFIPEALTDEAQRGLTRSSLCQYARPPNKTNLDAFYDLPTEPLFSLHCREAAGLGGPGQCVRPKGAPLCGAGQDTQRTEGGSPFRTSEVKQAYLRAPQTASQLVPRLRWTTLGRQYNWTTKEYDLGLDSPFPPDLDKLCRAIAVAVTNAGYRPSECGLTGHGGDDDWVSVNSYDGGQFKSQAGIINYYGLRDTLLGHVDRTEVNMAAPLISI